MSTLGFETWTAERWFRTYPEVEKPLFTMRLYVNATYTPRGTRIDGQLVTIRAFEGPRIEPNHTRLYCELWQGSPRKNRKPLFPRDSFYVGIPAHQSIDGREARECVLSLFCLKPGDTDDEFFEHYTPEELAFVQTYGEELDGIRYQRFPELDR